MEELPLADLGNRLSELVADVEKTHARVTLTKHGHPAPVFGSRCLGIDGLAFGDLIRASLDQGWRRPPKASRRQPSSR
ncbi:MAG: type II toxin-antitoxin system Phd/YefM family antitoxin [Acidimicrobiales bacterium]